MIDGTAFTVGIEEEYLLIHPDSGRLVQHPPKELLPNLENRLGSQVSPEFLECQIEIGTNVCGDVAEVRQDLARLRYTVAEEAGRFDLAIIASSTHPFAVAEEQPRTPKRRYDALYEDFQGVVRRLLISGMHVHVCIPDEDLRIDLMSQVTYILPHILALSTSSPFWKGEDTGLLSYRLAVWDQLPRTGLPPHFDNYSEFQRHVDVLVQAGIIEDATKIWWDLRPSGRYPTLEMRISDLCTTLDDTVTMAALYASWLHMLTRLRRQNQRWREYSSMLLAENRWRAHRYGVNEGLIDFGRGEIVPYPELLDELLAIIQPDAEALGCVDEVNHARVILERGTSAHRQLAVYRKAMEDGHSKRESLVKVVDWLRAETLNF